MDQNKPTFNSSNKAIQIIMLSLSVVAFIAFQYSSLFSSIKLLSYSSTDRHYIFLICNGLMLLVIKSSGLFAGSNPSGTEFYRDSHVIRNSQHQPAGFRENMNVKANAISHQYTYNNNNNTAELPTDELAETKADSCIKVVAKVEEAQGETTVMDNVTSTADYEEQEEGNDLINLIDEQQEQEQEEEVRQKDEQVQEQEHEIMLWSTEELNKKCDDFIRKMKYGIKYEARLVMV